jgi:hypothetical protein
LYGVKYNIVAAGSIVAGWKSTVDLAEHISLNRTGVDGDITSFVKDNGSEKVPIRAYMYNSQRGP